MSSIDRIRKRLDGYQQRHHFLGFPLAVVKKYSENAVSNQVALITYYGLLSLFPLFLALLTLTEHLFHPDNSLRVKLASLSLKYFPVIGNVLQHNLHGLHGHGIGVIAAVVERVDRPGFPYNLLRNVMIVFVGGGLMLTISLVSIYLAHLDSFGPIVHGSLYLLTTVAYSLVFLLVFRYGTAKTIPIKNFVLSAFIAGISWQILQLVDNYLIVHELRKLSSFYGTFAILLGLLFWIALQAELTLLAVEIDVVRTKKLWPRSLFTSRYTDKDREVYAGYVKSERRLRNENVQVTFTDEARH
jgi:uncharacterized BrkB/YihY/UPF0761 family membrane protein